MARGPPTDHFFFLKCILKPLLRYTHPGGASGKGPTCQCRRHKIPGLGRSPGGGPGNTLQYSCLENSITEGPGGLESIGLQRAGHD